MHRSGAFNSRYPIRRYMSRHRYLLCPSNLCVRIYFEDEWLFLTYATPSGASILFQAFLFSLTVIKFVSALRDGWGNTPLLTLLARDGTWAFFTLFSMSNIPIITRRCGGSLILNIYSCNGLRRVPVWTEKPCLLRRYLRVHTIAFWL